MAELELEQLVRGFLAALGSGGTRAAPLSGPGGPIASALISLDRLSVPSRLGLV